MVRRVTTAMTVLSVFVLGAPALAEDSKEPIKLTLHDWTGQLITTQLMGEALKAAGLNVTTQPNGAKLVFGTIDASKLEALARLTAVTYVSFDLGQP